MCLRRPGFTGQALAAAPGDTWGADRAPHFARNDRFGKLHRGRRPFSAAAGAGRRGGHAGRVPVVHGGGAAVGLGRAPGVGAHHRQAGAGMAYGVRSGGAVQAGLQHGGPVVATGGGCPQGRGGCGGDGCRGAGVAWGAVGFCVALLLGASGLRGGRDRRVVPSANVPRLRLLLDFAAGTTRHSRPWVTGV